jgi:hypothetical protein
VSADSHLHRRNTTPECTTPECDCGYCMPSSTKPALFMCQQRWDALPYEARVEITESVCD